MNEFFRKLSDRTSNAVGTPWAFVAALLIVVTRALTGPLFGFSEHQPRPRRRLKAVPVDAADRGLPSARAAHLQRNLIGRGGAFRGTVD